MEGYEAIRKAIHRRFKGAKTTKETDKAYGKICSRIARYIIDMTDGEEFDGGFEEYEEIVGNKVGPFDEELWKLLQLCGTDGEDDYKGEKSITQPTLQNLEFRLGHYIETGIYKKPGEPTFGGTRKKRRKGRTTRSKN